MIRLFFFGGKASFRKKIFSNFWSKFIGFGCSVTLAVTMITGLEEKTLDSFWLDCVCKNFLFNSEDFLICFVIWWEGEMELYFKKKIRR